MINGFTGEFSGMRLRRNGNRNASEPRNLPVPAEKFEGKLMADVTFSRLKVGHIARVVIASHRTNAFITVALVFSAFAER